MYPTHYLDKGHIEPYIFDKSYFLIINYYCIITIITKNKNVIFKDTKIMIFFKP